MPVSLFATCLTSLLRLFQTARKSVFSLKSCHWTNWNHILKHFKMWLGSDFYKPYLFIFLFCCWDCKINLDTIWINPKKMISTYNQNKALMWLRGCQCGHAAKVIWSKEKRWKLRKIQYCLPIQATSAISDILILLHFYAILNLSFLTSPFPLLLRLAFCCYPFTWTSFEKSRILSLFHFPESGITH